MNNTNDGKLTVGQETRAYQILITTSSEVLRILDELEAAALHMNLGEMQGAVDYHGRRIRSVVKKLLKDVSNWDKLMEASAVSESCAKALLVYTDEREEAEELCFAVSNFYEACLDTIQTIRWYAC